MATALAALGCSAEPALMAQAPRAEPARGAVVAPRPTKARNDWVRDWSTIPDTLGGEAVPLVMEVYGWLSWATSGTTRGLSNQFFDAVLLWRDGGNQKVPPGGRLAREDHERVLRAVIWAGWPDQGPGWRSFLQVKAVLRVKDAEANVWLPQAL